MNGTEQAERVDTLIIGAGQAGLSAGYHLAKRGMKFAHLGCGRASRRPLAAATWDSLRLYSPAWSDGLPGMRFPASSYHYPTGREMGDYLEAYAGRFDLPVVSGTRVDGVRPAEGQDGGYVVTAGDRRYEAAQRDRRDGSVQSPGRARRSRATSTLRSGNSIQASTTTRPTSTTARSSSSA